MTIDQGLEVLLDQDGSSSGNVGEGENQWWPLIVPEMGGRMQPHREERLRCAGVVQYRAGIIKRGVSNEDGTSV